MKNLTKNNSIIILTGASGKIGRVLADRMLEDNYNVLALVNSQASYDRLQKDYSQLIEAGRFHCHKLDLAVENDRDDFLKAIASSDLRIYGLVHAARSIETLRSDDTGYIQSSDFSKEFNVGVVAVYHLAWQLAQMTKLELKRVINLASIYGVVATNTHLYENRNSILPLNYGVVKSALIHLSKELAVRLAEQQVTVNSISYGGVEGRVDDAFKERYAKLCPMQGMLNHDDLFAAVSFLLSGEARSITGHNLVVDGGWTVW